MDYGEYISENLEESMDYVDYIAANLDKNIKYAEYVAESLYPVRDIMLERKNKIKKIMNNIK